MNQNTAAIGLPEARLPKLFKDIEFGEAILRVRDGKLAVDHQPRVRYSRKPRSHLGSRKCDANGKPQPSQAQAIRDFMADISPLHGDWEVAVQVANATPLKWEFEEVRPLRDTHSN